MAETLEARKKLRPLTSLLPKEKVKYRWQVYVKVEVLHKGASLVAYDADAAVSMLNTLGFDIPDEFLSPGSPSKQDGWKPV